MNLYAQIEEFRDWVQTVHEMDCHYFVDGKGFEDNLGHYVAVVHANDNEYDVTVTNEEDQIGNIHALAAMAVLFVLPAAAKGRDDVLREAIRIAAKLGRVAGISLDSAQVYAKRYDKQYKGQYTLIEVTVGVQLYASVNSAKCTCLKDFC